MVYRGKPSAACEECRRKRSRCDRALPSCGQCIRTKRKCSGYRNTMDLMFFDQTQEAAQKSRQQGHRAPNRSGTLTPQARQSIEKAATPKTLRNVMICQSLDDLAVNYFMRIYIGANPDPAQLGFVSDIYSREGPTTKELQQSLKAVGLAGYSRVTQRPDLLMTATGSYVVAIREINLKLSFVNFGNADNALLTSIVLLAMFEIMVLPSDEGYRNFSRHIRGAVSLSCMLLKQKKYVDRKILQSIMYCVIGESWLSNQGLPPEFFILYQELGPQKQPDSVYAFWMDMLIENMKFRYSIESGELSDPKTIVQEALRIHQRTRQFMSAPNIGRYNSVFLPPPSGDKILDTSFYADHEVNFRVHCWNNLRMCWIHLHQLIVAQCSALLSSCVNPDDTLMNPAQAEPVSIAAQHAMSKAAIMQIAREMCMSMPELGNHERLAGNLNDFELGEISNLPFENGSYPKSMDIPASLLLVASPRASGLFIMTYQLQNISNIPDLPQDLHGWIHRRLDEIRSITDPNDTRFLQTLLRRLRLDQASPITSPGIMIKSEVC